MNKLLNVILVCILISVALILSTAFTNETDNDDCTWIEYNEYANLDSKKVIWLSKIINSESHGESLHDKLLVGSVILNRVKSKKFPNSIYGVIHHRNQFDGLRSKYFRYSKKTASDKSSIRAAQIVLAHGPINKKILFFLNPRISTDSKWVKKVMKRKLEARSENHYFYS